MTDRKPSTITAGASGVTLINVYEVEPDRQEALAALLSTLTRQTIRQQPGFVSVNIHRSLDGTRVVNYAQWASREAFEAFVGSPAAKEQLKQFAAVAKRVSPGLYQVDDVIAA